MTDRGVIYQLSGTRHAPVLLVSLATLRRHWEGAVTIMVADPSADKLARKIAAPHDADVKEFQALPGRNGAYVNKTRLWRFAPYRKCVFLDADTLVVGKIDEVFPEGVEFVTTSFGDWTSNGACPVPKRIKKWQRFAPHLVADQLAQTYPALNTGVFGFSTKPACDAMEAWEQLTQKNPSFMCDEIAAQLLVWKFPHRILDDRFNCSPLFGSAPTPGPREAMEAWGDEKWARASRERRRHEGVIRGYGDVRVWHAHGRKHLLEPIRSLWWPEFERLLEENVAGVREWMPAGDNRLAEFLGKRGAA